MESKKISENLKKMKAALCFIMALIIMLFPTVNTLASDVWKINESAVAAGYYTGDDISLVVLADDTMYIIKTADGSMKSTRIELKKNGSDYVIHTSDQECFALKKQDKDKSEDGGIYYALYTEYAGSVEETSFSEGKQEQFGDWIFGNDYDVVVKYPLSKFFGAEATGVDITGKSEGDGYDTPEEAVEAYINGMIQNDYDAMVAAFSVESFIDNYDLKYTIEKNQGYQLGIPFLPDTGEITYRINLEGRRSQIMGTVRAHYLLLNHSEDILNSSLSLKDYDSVEDMYHSIFPVDDTDYLSDITFDREYYDPDFLTNGQYGSDDIQKNMSRNAKSYGVDEIESVIAKIYCNGEPVLLGPDVGRYGNKWYVLYGQGMAMTLMGCMYNMYGMYPCRLITDDGLLEKIEEENIGKETDDRLAQEVEDAKTETDSNEQEVKAANIGDKFTFTYKGTSINMHEEFEPILEELGEPKSYTEEDSSAFEGLDKKYVFTSFVVTTYPDNGKDRVESVTFLDDTVSTADGICIGDAQERVEETYGEEFYTGGSAYIISKEDTTLVIIVENGTVSNIQYHAVFG